MHANEQHADRVAATLGYFEALKHQANLHRAGKRLYDDDTILRLAELECQHEQVQAIQGRTRAIQEQTQAIQEHNQALNNLADKLEAAAGQTNGNNELIVATIVREVLMIVGGDSLHDSSSSLLTDNGSLRLQPKATTVDVAVDATDVDAANSPSDGPDTTK